MHLELINIDQICENFPEVTSHKAIENNKYNKDGLFSVYKFGPVHSYRCLCGKYSGRKYKNKKCEVCHTEINSSSIRRKRFGKIVLPIPILNPIFYYLLTSSKSSSKTVLDNMIDFKQSYYIKEEEITKKGITKKVKTLCTINSENQNLIKPEDILFGVKGMCKYIEFLIEDKTDSVSNFVREHQDKWIISNVLVIPPGCRPCGRDNNGLHVLDSINRLYTDIIVRCNSIRSISVRCQENDMIYNMNCKHLHRLVLELYNHIFEKLSKKSGLIRSNILGKRLDFSGRAVITPNPTLNLDECRIPYFMLLEIFKPQLIPYLINKRLNKRYNSVIKTIDEHIKNHNYDLYDIVEEFCKDKVCILNRQPSLHRLSILGFKIKPTKGNTIQIPPLATSPYNADFDGDSVVCDVTILDTIISESLNCSICDINEIFTFNKTSEKIREDNVKVTHYSPVENLKIQAINLETGDIEWKKILDYSVHENLELYKITDKENRFKPFWSSKDHSLIVFDENEKIIKRITPQELINNPEGKYFIQKGN